MTRRYVLTIETDEAGDWIDVRMPNAMFAALNFFPNGEVKLGAGVLGRWTWREEAGPLEADLVVRCGLCGYVSEIKLKEEPMGLDVSHDAFSGAYSSFHRFRLAIVAAMRGRVVDNESFAGSWGWEFPEGWTNETHPGLYALLTHSDYNGEIAASTCAQLADELEALLPALGQLPGQTHMPSGWRHSDKAKQFIAGCRRAAAANEPLEFH